MLYDETLLRLTQYCEVLRPVNRHHVSEAWFFVEVLSFDTIQC